MIPVFNAASHIPLKDDRRSLDVDKARAETMWLEEHGANSIVISVPAAAPYLTPDQIIAYIKAANEVRKKLKIICDVGARGTFEAINLAQKAVENGVEYIMMCPPVIFPISNISKKRYFMKIASSIPNTEVIIYNLPKYTSNPIDLPLLKELLRDLSNVGGVKETIDNLIEFRQAKSIIEEMELKEKVRLVIGEDSMIWDAFLVGQEIGTISTFCSMWLEHVIELRGYANNNDNRKGRELGEKFKAYKNEVVRKLDYLVAQQATATIRRNTGGYNPEPFASPTKVDIDYVKKKLKEIGL